jgi:hypothetical protein
MTRPENTALGDEGTPRTLVPWLGVSLGAAVGDQRRAREPAPPAARRSARRRASISRTIACCSARFKRARASG